MEENRKNLTIIVAALCVAVVGLTIAYAALSANLSVTLSNVTQNAASWDVGFDTSSATVTGKASGTSTTGITCGNATVSKNSVSVAATTLSKPGDTCTYDLTIKNTGDIIAKLSSITSTAPSGCEGGSTASLVCGNLTYKLTTSDTQTLLATSNAQLAAKTGTLATKLIVTYSGSSLNTVAVTQENAGFTLNYSQA